MRAAALALLAAAALQATAAAATVRTLDGRTLVGETLSFLEEGRVVSLGDQTIALADCEWISFAEAPSPAAQQAPLPRTAVLSDGGWLPIDGVAGAGGDRLRITGPVAAGELSLGQIVGWGSPGWLSQPTAARRDRVLLKTGDYLGTVTDLRAGILHLELDGLGAVELPVAEVLGLRLAMASPPADGLRLALRCVASWPPLRLRPGAPLRLEAGDLALASEPRQALQVLGGRRTWLSDLEPATVEEEGAFGVVWPHRRDANLDGSPLVLGGVRYDRGLVVHSRARLEWDLGGAYQRLHAMLGIADRVGRQGDCVVILRGDARELARHEIRGGGAPLPIDCDLSGVQKLELVVDYGRRYDIGDHVALADAWLLRAE